jgi:K+-sensing histidine kinase KdpD
MKGDKEINFIINNLNKMMLELQAFKSFHIDQVVDERNKSNAVMNTISDSVLLIDSSGEVIHHNLKALGILKIELKTKGFTISDIKNEGLLNLINDVINSKEQKGNIEFENKDDRKFYLISFSKFRIPSIKKDGIFFVMRDITVEKEIQKTKEDFFHMITHDMRAPLSTIRGYLEIIFSDKNTSEKYSRYIENINYSVNKLAGMIDDILNMTKLEGKRFPIKKEPIYSKELAERVILSQKLIAKLKEINLYIDKDFEDITFISDNTLLERVLINLVGNSLKFTTKSGEIKIGCYNDNEKVYFYVSDTGPGIPEDKRKSIFEKYVQMEEHREMGFGLGLAMCKSAIENLGGEIWVESELGKGAKFIFNLPKEKGT